MSSRAQQFDVAEHQLLSILDTLNVVKKPGQDVVGARQALFSVLHDLGYRYKDDKGRLSKRAPRKSEDVVEQGED